MADAPAAPTIPSASRPPIGGGFNLAAPMPVDIDFPGMPKRYYEFGPVRFKFLLDGKYEIFSANAKGERINMSNEVKVDMKKQSGSYKAGLKAKLTPSIDAQAIGKLSGDSIRHIGLAAKDPRKFGLGLMRYLDVVIGTNFKVDSKYMSFAGMGFALDPDFCFFSVLLPLRYPLMIDVDGGKVGGQIVADLIVKVGPSKEAWMEWGKKLGFRNLYTWVRLMVIKANQQLPKAVTTAAAATEELSASAFLEALGTWFGAFSLAVPISFALKDFCLYICNSARQAGIRDAEQMNYARYYIRAAYGLESMPEFSDRTRREAYQKAVDDMNKYGKVELQQFLERRFMGGSRLADEAGENPNRIQVQMMAERMWLRIRGR